MKKSRRTGRFGPTASRKVGAFPLMTISSDTWSLEKRKQIARPARARFVQMSSRRLLQRSTRTPEKMPNTTEGTTNESTSTVVKVDP